jgi:hypothetical protein
LTIFLEFTLKKRQISNSSNVFLTTVRKFAKNNFTGSYTGNHPPGDVALAKASYESKNVLKSFYNLVTF